MCKFENDSSPGFDLVVDAIQRYSDKAPSQTKARWSAEEKERVIQKEAAVEELIPGRSCLRLIGGSSSLMCLGSVKASTPQSDSTSTFAPSPGKSMKALPSPEQQSFLQDEYTVEEFEDDNVKVAR